MTPENATAPLTIDRQLKTGDQVIYFDEYGLERNALVTAVWGDRSGVREGSTFADCEPSLNILFISPDEKREDSYGRQIERRSSCCHVLYQGAWGNSWCLPEQLEEARIKVSKAKEEFRDA